MWSIGVALYTLVFGRLPFGDRDTQALYFSIVHNQVFIPQHCSPGERVFFFGAVKLFKSVLAVLKCFFLLFLNLFFAVLKYTYM